MIQPRQGSVDGAVAAVHGRVAGQGVKLAFIQRQVQLQVFYRTRTRDGQDIGCDRVIVEQTAQAATSGLD